MNLYFSSAYPVALKLNGIYFDTICGEVKTCKIESNIFVEACPLTSGEETINFFPNEKFFLNPPSNVIVTDLKGGYLLRFEKNLNKNGFQIFGQEKYSDLVVTLFNENGIKLSIETQNDFYAESVFTDVNILAAKKVNVNNNDFLMINLTGKANILLLFKINEKIEKKFEREISSFSFDNNFSTTEKLIDIAKHEITINWVSSNYIIKEDSRSVKTKDSYSVEKLKENILPYAFCEEFYAGGNIDIFLGDNILKNSNKLKNYFGQFLGIMPPPLFRNENEIGLIYKLKENLYEVKYFVFEINNRKIINIKQND